MKAITLGTSWQGIRTGPENVSRNAREDLQQRGKLHSGSSSLSCRRKPAWIWNWRASANYIADRVGHESIDITYRYAHLFPSTQIEMADKLDVENDRLNGADDIDDEDATDNCKIVNIDDYLVG